MKTIEFLEKPKLPSNPVSFDYDILNSNKLDAVQFNLKLKLYKRDVQ